MGFEVETLKFEGPLDLMLHLIREKQLDIFDLDMEVLTDQYIEYIHNMEKLELEIESEYLVELATLIEYKSKGLLPKPQEMLEGEYEEDPKERLVKRLLEYQKYKEITETLNEAYLDRQEKMAKPISSKEINEASLVDTKIEGDPNDLLKAMTRVLRRMQLSKPLDTKVTKKELSTEDRVLEIKQRLRKLPKKFNFKTLIEDCVSIHEYVITFLAILTMAKEHTIIFNIDSNDDIWFTKGVKDE